jgi:hypothetical protein
MSSLNTSSLTNSQKSNNKRSSWRWWQHNNNSSNSDSSKSDKNPENDSNDDNLVIDEEGSTTTGKQDCSLSIAQSSLLVYHSIHSKESEDITSTTSIKSKPWISQQYQPCSSSVTKFDEEETVLEPNNKAESNPSANKNLDNNNSNTAIVTPSSSLLMNVPSMISSTAPVINYKPEQDQRHRRKSSDNALFSGFKVGFC